MLKKIALSPWTALITLLFVLSIRISDTPFVESIRLRYFDTLITNAEPIYNDIYSVNIDESTLDKYGQWPFDRRVYAELITDLYKRNAGIVVFNVMMSEKDRMGGDSELVKVLKETPVILTSRTGAISKNEPHTPGIAIINSQYIDSLLSYPGLISNLKEIEDTSLGVGIVDTMPEVDGVTRRLPLVATVNGKTFPSVSMEVLRVAAGDTTTQIKLQPNGIEKMRIPKFGPITTDEKGRIWIDWSQQNKKVSAIDLPEDFGQAVVVVGVTAAGIGNPVSTANGYAWPQDVQAAVIGTLLNQVNIERPDYADGAEKIVMLAAGLVLLLLTRWVYIGLGSVVVMAVAGVYGSMYAFEHYLLLLDATAFTVMILLVSLHAYGVKFVSEFLQKQAIKKQFAGYCSKEVVELLQKDPDLIRRGVRKDVSVMFSDLRGFTPIGEHYGDDVAGLGKYMNGYMDAISQPMLDNNGMIIKYVGDASMHLHGAPIEDPNHARTIVRVGLEMLDRVDEYTKLMEAQGLPPAAMGWGCNTGIGFIGEMGSTERHSYDILGDMVSTAARLEARCKAYGVLCIIGAETYNRTKDDFFYLMLDNLQPKGKTVADLIYTALRTKGADYTIDRSVHDAMHELYKQKRFDEAAAMCKEMKDLHFFGGQMDKYYKMWIERCEFMKHQDLGDNWNGEFIAHEK
jgi:adenylate cyclase